MPEGRFGALIAAAVFVVFVAVLLRLLKIKSTTIFEWQRGLLYRDGRFARELGPGKYWQVPGRVIHTVSIVPEILLVGPQEVLTADRFLVKLAAVVSFRTVDARTAFEGSIAGRGEALRTRVQLALRDLVVVRTLEALLEARPVLDAELTAGLGAATATLGVQVETAEIRDLILAAEVRRMYTDIERARREGQVSLERARAEQASLRALANAARMLKGNPELMNLRLLQALQGTGNAQPTIVLGGGTGIVPIKPGQAAEEPPPAEE